MTKFTALSKKVSKKEVKTVFKYVVSSGRCNILANTIPNEWDEIIFLATDNNGLSLFKAVDKNGLVAFYTGIKGTEFDD